MKLFNKLATVGFSHIRLDASAQERCFPNTTCRVLDGKVVAQQYLSQCRSLSASRTQPRLAVVLVGDDPASHVYVRLKSKTFTELGFASEINLLSEQECTQESLSALIDSLNQRPDVHGILVQLPLPRHVNAPAILERISPKKDVDGFHALNMGQLVKGTPNGMIPCTPLGIMALLEAYGVSLSSQNVVVVGRSNIVGKPLAFLCLGADATVTMAHSRTQNLPSVCREADILISATGHRGLITRDCVKPGAIVIDVGTSRSPEGKICGDVDPAVVHIASAMTPMPGGVGPLTIAMLCVNTAYAAWKK